MGSYVSLFMTLDMYISMTSRAVQSGRTMTPHSDAVTQAGRQTDVQRSDINKNLSIMTL